MEFLFICVVVVSILFLRHSFYFPVECLGLQKALRYNDFGIVVWNNTGWLVWKIVLNGRTIVNSTWFSQLTILHSYQVSRTQCHECIFCLGLLIVLICSILSPSVTAEMHKFTSLGRMVGAHFGSQFCNNIPARCVFFISTSDIIKLGSVRIIILSLTSNPKK